MFGITFFFFLRQVWLLFALTGLKPSFSLSLPSSWPFLNIFDAVECTEAELNDTKRPSAHFSGERAPNFCQISYGCKGP